MSVPDHKVCSGFTATTKDLRCDRAAAFFVAVPNEPMQYACRMHIGQVVKRWAAPPVSAIIQVTAVSDG